MCKYHPEIDINVLSRANRLKLLLFVFDLAGTTRLPKCQMHIAILKVINSLIVIISVFPYGLHTYLRYTLE